MNLEIIEKRLSAYLDEFWSLNDITPFLLVYIHLLLLFKYEFSETQLNVILNRQRQLLGEEFNRDVFDEAKKSSQSKIDNHLGSNNCATKETALNRLLFCALLDAEENDFFYLTEPIFEFVREMHVSADQLRQILESEFSGFRV